MPQMAPISWLTLFFIFSISFMIFNVLNYYCFNNFNSKKEMNSPLYMTKKILTWKW